MQFKPFIMVILALVFLAMTIMAYPYNDDSDNEDDYLNNRRDISRQDLENLIADKRGGSKWRQIDGVWTKLHEVIKGVVKKPRRGRARPVVGPDTAGNIFGRS